MSDSDNELDNILNSLADTKLKNYEFDILNYIFQEEIKLKCTDDIVDLNRYDIIKLLVKHIKTYDPTSKKFKRQINRLKSVIDPQNKYKFTHNLPKKAPVECVTIFFANNLRYLAGTKYLYNKNFVTQITYEVMEKELNDIYNNGCIFDPNVAEIYISGWSIDSKILREVECIESLYRKWFDDIYNKLLFIFPAEICDIITEYISN